MEDSLDIDDFLIFNKKNITSAYELSIIEAIENDDIYSIHQYAENNEQYQIIIIYFSIRMHHYAIFDEIFNLYHPVDMDLMKAAIFQEDQYFLKKLMEYEFPQKHYVSAIGFAMAGYDATNGIFLLSNVRLILDTIQIPHLKIFLIMKDNPSNAIERFFLLFDKADFNFDDKIYKIPYGNLKPEYFSFLLDHGLDLYARDVLNHMVRCEYSENPEIIIKILLDRFHHEIDYIELPTDLIMFILEEDEDYTGDVLMETLSMINEYGIEIRVPDSNKLKNITKIFQLAKII